MKHLLASLTLLASAVLCIAAPSSSLNTVGIGQLTAVAVGATPQQNPASGTPVILTWTKGPSCGAVVAGQTVTCTVNVYQCIGTCAAWSTTTASNWTAVANTQAENGTYTFQSPPQAGSLSYVVTDCAMNGGWNGACPTGPGTGSESSASNVATVTFQPAAPTNATAQ